MQTHNQTFTVLDQLELPNLFNSGENDLFSSKNHIKAGPSDCVLLFEQIDMASLDIWKLEPRLKKSWTEEVSCTVIFQI